MREEGSVSGSLCRLLTRVVVLLGAVVAVLATAGYARAATINVSTGPQLEAAVATAAAGDVIVMANGNYAPAATLEIKVPLTITGSQTFPGSRISGSNVTQSFPPDLVIVDAGVTATINNVTMSTTANSGNAVTIFGKLGLNNSTVS